jgi:hypothetical protein
MRTHFLIAFAAGVALGGEALVAQEQPTPPPGPEEQPASPPEGDLPSLDDLLDLSDSDKPAADDAARRELEDLLAGEKVAEEFGEAVRLMGQTADRLQTGRDTGLATQRLQEDVLKKLDAMIAAAKEQKNDQNSSSGAASEKHQNQPNQPQSTQNQAGSGENKGQVDPPARTDGAVNPPVDSAGAAWGGLPARVREALSQGQADSYSAIYRALTEAYYRRLAEEAGK